MNTVENSQSVSVKSMSVKSASVSKDLNPESYLGPKMAAEALTSYVERSGWSKGKIRVLDVGAGTGFVAIQLANRGFKRMDALDPSEGMLEKAKTRGVYENFIQEFLTPDPTPGIANDTYDAVVSSGGMGEGHIPCGALREMVRVVKPGGLVVIAMREEYLRCTSGYENLEPTMAAMENEELWERLERSVLPGYCYHKDGLVYVFRKK
ncbi:methyltransferase-like protein 27 isoform X2 [Lingula anatina]|uniref:Methyltransferase-like protein 27 isoform X2 n=1 Tax=Lingula anatina TaxID=7574 RepID=A0A1S3JNU6_LINAN|nr:methyltransferase-like protein 27 isoform X2 [Lingula anatina]|eukprot:XP_013412045.1 methyltransferase-like protein 27 isoform X2 [Lingula anatina]